MESRKNSIHQGKVHQLVVQYPTASPENILTCNIIYTKQVLHINVCPCACVYMQYQLMNIESMNLKENKKNYRGVYRGNKEKGKNM